MARSIKLVPAVLLVLLLSANNVESLLIPKHDNPVLLRESVDSHKLTEDIFPSIYLSPREGKGHPVERDAGSEEEESEQLNMPPAENRPKKENEKNENDKRKDIMFNKLLLMGSKDPNEHGSSIWKNENSTSDELLPMGSNGHRSLIKQNVGMTFDKSSLMGPKDPNRHRSSVKKPGDRAFDKSLLMGPKDPNDHKSLIGFTGFPYKYEQVPKILKKSGTPEDQLSIESAVQVSVQSLLDRDDDEDHDHRHHGFGHQPAHGVIHGAQSPHIRQIHHQRPHQHHRPDAEMTKTELDFIGILAAIVVKLVISTALASWFLVAGTSLYSLAALTGTTAVFGQDSTIGYIYKTLPLVETLLRGEVTFYPPRR